MNTNQLKVVKQSVISSLSPFRFIVHEPYTEVKCRPMWAGGSFFAAHQNKTKEFSDIDLFVKVPGNFIYNKDLTGAVVKRYKELFCFDTFYYTDRTAYFASTGYKDTCGLCVLGHFYVKIPQSFIKQKVQIILTSNGSIKTLERFDIINLRVGATISAILNRVPGKLAVLCNGNVVLDGLKISKNSINRATKYVDRIKWQYSNAAAYVYVSDHNNKPVIFKLSQKILYNDKRGVNFVKYVMNNFSYNNRTFNSLTNYKTLEKVYEIKPSEVDRLFCEFSLTKFAAKKNKSGEVKRLPVYGTGKVTTTNLANIPITTTSMLTITNRHVAKRCKIHDKELFTVTIGGAFNKLRGQKVCSKCLQELLKQEGASSPSRLSLARIAAATSLIIGAICAALKVSGIL